MASDPRMSINEFEKRMGVTGKVAAKCESHGSYIAVIRGENPPTKCPTCAKVETAEREYQAEMQQFLIRYLPRAGIPERFASKTLVNYEARTREQQLALAVCVKFVDEFAENLRAGRCMLMLGKVGTGKTHLAVGIANRLLRRDMVPVMYRTAGGIMTDIRGTYDGGEGSEFEILKSLRLPKLLIIDEVGATKPSDFEQATLFRVINARYEANLPTIVISNLDVTELPAVMGERSFDRLRENGGIAVKFEWASERGIRHA